MKEPLRSSSVPEDSPTAGSLRATLLRVAWLAIVLGFVMEVLLLLVAAGFGVFAGLEAAIADLVRQVSWSTIVCVGLGLGTAASKNRAPVMGLLGLLSAPAAFNISRAFHRGALQALGTVGGVSGGLSLLLMAFLRGAEYGCLGVLIGWVGQRPWGGAMAHVASGLLVGVFFGGAILALTYQTAAEPLATADLLSRIVNEILFPVGCSLVLFSATALGERTAR